uniref:PX domain-containing protein n=1 Tax=Anisakis simplex TaxID=6269 RepID=A0A0M3JI46_ANISI
LIGNARKWSVERRYTQFREMNKNLEKFGVELGFPPKKAIGNTKEQFIVQRKEALQVCARSNMSLQSINLCDF